MAQEQPPEQTPEFQEEQHPVWLQHDLWIGYIDYDDVKKGLLVYLLGTIAY